jgi:membrane protease YdiL (CAAX protease family)
MMLTPAVGVGAALLFDRGARSRELLGLRLGRPGWPWYWAFGWLAIPALCLAAPFVAAGLGLYTLDLAELSGFRELIESAGGGEALERLTPHQLLGLQLSGLLVAPIVNAPFTLGEELGWRGYLLPRLLPLGQSRALIASGVVWGVWHAPAILLGHNYPEAPVLGVLLMTAFCVITGMLLGWTRLATGSVWPAVIAHGALNGSAGIILSLSREGTSIDLTQVGITGWSGWLLPLALIALLVWRGRLPVRATDQPSSQE